jgi:RNA polymerase sigma factor (TIGR02999 family)
MNSHDSFDDWFTGAYSELHALSQRSSVYERPGHTLTPTAILHEAYITLKGTLEKKTTDNAFLFACFKKTIRRKLIDYARYKNSHKRGGKHRRPPVGIESALDRSDSDLRSSALLFLEQLQLSHPRAAAVANMRLNTDLSLPLIADRLGVSLRSVSYDWKIAVDYAREWYKNNG